MKKMFFFVSLLVALSLALAANASAGSSMERILKKGELVVGTSGTQPPMSAVNKKGELIGLDVDLSKAMADAMGVKLKFAQMPFADLLPALEAGKVDMILSGMTVTAERNKKVAFVGPYVVTGKGILAVEARFAALKEAKGLDAPEVKVGALKDSTSQKFAETSMAKAKLTLFGSYEEGIDLLLRNKIDVIVADFQFCALTAYRDTKKGLIAGQSALTFEPLGIAMVEDTLLINWVQNFLNQYQGTGELKKVSEKWLNPGSWIDDLP
ncbi:MAG: transporter substrate-binding domain-containing protein [Desulfobacterota bacterium]|jgi:polar amino acid transport system substrate-binding protein|nr:transporter substrate-binding domain-containing protein [Thermodesulfobacteriota bacterium]